MTTRVRVAVCAIVAVVVAPGCVPALRDLPAADRASPPPPASEVDPLLERAARLFDTRSVPEVREALATWVLAATADTGRIEGLVGAARAGVWLAEHESDGGARENAAVEAVRAAQRCAQNAPDRAECAYWLGAALGVQARERPTTAHSALPILVDAFVRAAAIDPLLEEAGPDRALALVYLRAPGWPAGPGNPDRGLEHARQAVARRPDHPPNLLALAEALAATEDRPSARATCLRALEAARSAERVGNLDAQDWLREAGALLARLPEE